MGGWYPLSVGIVCALGVVGFLKFVAVAHEAATFQLRALELSEKRARQRRVAKEAEPAAEAA